jgi:hypothetical protein
VGEITTPSNQAGTSSTSVVQDNIKAVAEQAIDSRVNEVENASRPTGERASTMVDELVQDNIKMATDSRVEARVGEITTPSNQSFNTSTSVVQDNIKAAANRSIEARATEAATPSDQAVKPAASVVQDNIKVAADQAIDTRANTASQPTGERASTMVDELVQEVIKAAADSRVEARANEAATPSNQSFNTSTSVVQGNIKAAAQEAIDARANEVENASRPTGERASTLVNELVQDNIKTVADSRIDARVEAATQPTGQQASTLVNELIQDNIKAVADSRIEARATEAATPSNQAGKTATSIVQDNIKTAADQAIDTRADTDSRPTGERASTMVNELVQDNIKAAADIRADARASEAAVQRQAIDVNAGNVKSALTDVSAKFVDVMTNKYKLGSIIQSPDQPYTPKLSSYIITNIVEGIPKISPENDLPKLTSSGGVTDRYDESHLDNETTLRTTETLSFGHSYSEMFTSMVKGKRLLTEFFGPKIKESIESPDVTKITSNGDIAGTTKSTWQAFLNSRAVNLTVSLIGHVGDMMDVLGTVMLFTDAFYMKPEFQQKLITYSSFQEALRFSVDAQIKAMYGNKNEGYLGYNDRCKALNDARREGYPFQYVTYPLISGPLDYLERGPGKNAFHSQARFKIELNSVREVLLKDPTKPYREKMRTALGGDVYDAIVADPKYKLWWYASGGLNNYLAIQDVDNLYRDAFKTVCDYHGGKVYEDTHTGVDSDGNTDALMNGRPRFQCGWSIDKCIEYSDKWTKDNGKLGGNYAEFYNWDDLVGLDGKLKIPAGHQLRTTPDASGACIITNSGIRQMCKTSEGNYNNQTHTCTYTPEFCQDRGMCYSRSDRLCYLPGDTIEGFSALVGEYAVRQYIKIYGCNVNGLADMVTFPINLATGKGKEWFTAMTENKCIDENFKTLLKSPAYAAGFATSVVGVGTMMSGVGGPVGIFIAVACLAVMGLTIGIEYGEQNKINGRFPPNDMNEYTVGGWRLDSTGAKIGPKMLGFSPGWITKPLPITAPSGRVLTSFEDDINSSPIPGLFTCKFFDDQGDIRAAYDAREALYYTATLGFGAINLSDSKRAEFLSDAVDDYLFRTKWPVKVTCHSGCQKSGGGTDNWVLQGTRSNGIRAASNGSGDKIWCLPPFPTTAYADPLIGVLADADPVYNTNRTWTDGAEPTIATYPTGPKIQRTSTSCSIDNPRSGAAFVGGESNASISQWRYQLVYRKDPTDAERVDPNSTWWNSSTNMPRKIWDTVYLRKYFSNLRIGQMRKYYCSIAFTQKTQNSSSPFDKKCYGYLSIDLKKYTFLPMTVISRNKTLVSATVSSCPEGYYTTSSGCYICPPGTHIPVNSKLCQACPAGTYSGSGAVSCNRCPPGKYSTTGSSACMSCPPGTYSSLYRSSVCTACPAGYAFAGTNGTSVRICARCPIGTYAPSGSSTCIQCSPGTYSATPMSSSCSNCPPGTSSSVGATSSTSCTTCPPGTYSVGGSPCTPCPVGKISLAGAAGATSCFNCPAGTHTVDGGISCTYCPAGKTSVAGGPCTNCPVGQSSLYGLCTDCPAGTYNGIEGGLCTNCPAGKTSVAAGGRYLSDCVNCQPGESSVAGGSCTNCPAGTYNEIAGGLCTNCPAGKISVAPGARYCTSCQAGQSSVAGATSCTNCPAGKYSLIGSVCVNCPAGQSSVAGGACTNCPAGKSSVAGGACTNCPAGQTSYLQASSIQGPCVPCPAGKTSVAGGVCTNCPPGKTSVAGATSCTNCPAGQSSLYGLCTPCPAGKTSVAGGPCTNCPVGQSSLSGGLCTNCPAGQSSSYPGGLCTPCRADQTSVSGGPCICPANYMELYNSVFGTYSCLPCPDGQTSVAGGQCTYCPAGKTSVAGGPCTNCPIGQSSMEGSICLDCPEGQSSVAGGVCTPCPAGQSSLSGGVCTPCPAGTYSVAGATSCTDCPAGQSSPAGATSCTFCPAGTSSRIGIGLYNQPPLCTPCKAGQSSVSGGLCAWCLPGSISVAPGATSCTNCPAGQSSVGGATSCTNCPAGTTSVAGGRCCPDGQTSVAGGRCTPIS